MNPKARHAGFLELILQRMARSRMQFHVLAATSSFARISEVARLPTVVSWSQGNGPAHTALIVHLDGAGSAIKNCPVGFEGISP
jgi:hypothetical protein